MWNGNLLESKHYYIDLINSSKANIFTKYYHYSGIGFKKAKLNQGIYRKIDNKGRDSEYFTFRIQGILVTIVCDARTHKVLTGIIETHNRPQFRMK